MSAEAAGVSLRQKTPDTILGATALLVVIAIFLMALPIVILLVTAFGLASLSTVGYSVKNFSLILNDPLLIPVLYNTLIVGIGTVAVMLALTIPCAWLYTRTDLPRKDLLIALLTVKIAVPGFLVAMGYVFLFNPSNGIGNQLIEQVFGIRSLFNVYTLGWIAVLQGAALTPPAFFMLVPTMRAIDAALEEAAWSSGVKKLTTVLRIVLPLSAPALFATCIYFFIIAIEMFDYAGMLGLPSRTLVLSTWLYQMIYMTDSLPEYGPAAALGLLSAVAAILLAGGYIWSTRQTQRYAVVTGKAPRTKSDGTWARRKGMGLAIHPGIRELFSFYPITAVGLVFATSVCSGPLGGSNRSLVFSRLPRSILSLAKSSQKQSYYHVRSADHKHFTGNVRGLGQCAD